jgi:hypothetical protein
MPSDLTVYCVDSSALIHAWRRAYPIKNFAVLWKRFDELIDSERFVSCIAVLDEIERKDDTLHGWCKVRRQMFLPIDDALQEQVILIMGKYPRLVDTAKGRSGADPFVIGLASMNSPRWTILSEESPGKVASPKIPDVCQREGIPCARLVELIEREGWIFA